MAAVAAAAQHGALDQTERAFQKQRGISLHRKSGTGSSKKNQSNRYWKEVGLGFATPQEAKTGTYVDRKCPFTSDVSIRGRILKGMCISTKMQRTIIVRTHYLHFRPKYSRYEKRHRNFAVHCSPAFDIKEGDLVTFGQCRPLAKTVRFNVLKVEKNQIFGAARKQFQLF